MAGLISVLAFGLGSRAVAVDGFSGSLIGDLAGASDLTPLIVADSAVEVLPTATRAPAVSSSRGRQSLPAADRAVSYREAEVFQNSKVALPLLVADLEPKVIPMARPMTGRSVGARPSAAWTRPGALPGAVAEGSDSQPAVAWTSLGGR